MTCNKYRVELIFCLALAALSSVAITDLVGADDSERICVSGRYPHLTLFNHGNECGIGAVVPWADRLWAITYSPHKPTGSDDALVEVDTDLNLVIRSESIGGTPANRMIHRESEQLFIGPYVIDSKRNVRVIPYDRAIGRPTATIRHLTDPANKVYTFTMEEGLYEIDVHTLDVVEIHRDAHKPGFEDYLPGYHGKGGYSGQGHVVVSNNGERRQPHGPFYDTSGCLAEWDGKTWTVIERNQFNEVTGPGGIFGNGSDDDPIWATGWDRRSLILRVRDNGRWHRFRLPIGSYCYVASHGWYTEWPRIRSVGPDGQYLMNMHGLWFDLPKTFSAANTGGLHPIASYLKITGDFCRWHDRLVFACDDTAITGGNRFVNQSQSNFWFTDWKQLRQCGAPAGWGGVWQHDDVAANTPSDPYHFAGYTDRVLHLAHDSDGPVTFAIELDTAGDGTWNMGQEITVPAHGYIYHVFPNTVDAQWIRLRTDRECKSATAYFHYGPGGGAVADPEMFAALADVEDEAARSVGIIRPRGGDLGTLQYLATKTSGNNQQGEPSYYEVGPQMQLGPLLVDLNSATYLAKTAALEGADFQVDAASAVVEIGGVRYRLPVSHEAYRQPWAIGWPRGKREVSTERRLFNCCGTFYVLPHKSAGGILGLKPVATHNKRITDFCSWRGMLVLAGTRAAAAVDGHYFASADAAAGLWFGDIDDLWRMGKPRGEGGPWRETAVQTSVPSDPYLMTGFDRKQVELTHDADRTVRFRVEIDFIRDGSWYEYTTIEVPTGKSVTHQFSDGFSAHWVRVVADADCTATAWFVYE